MTAYFYCFCSFLLIINSALYAQSPQALDAQVQQAIEPHKENFKALYQTLKALEQDSDFDFKRSKKANLLLGYCYQIGQGTPIDVRKGHSYLWHSGELGEKEAYHLISIYYAAVDLNNPIELEEQILANQRGATMGVSFCMWQLYYLYKDGEGSLPKDKELALFWLKKAAYLGQPRACEQLAILYEEGRFVEKNLAQAQRFYQAAAAQKNTPASQQLSLLELEAAATKTDEEGTYEELVAFFKKDLARFGTVIDASLAQGKKYEQAIDARKKLMLRFVVNEGTASGYFPIIKINCYDQNRNFLGEVTSTSSQIKRVNEHLTVVEITVKDAPAAATQVTIEAVRCSGHLIMVEF